VACIKACHDGHHVIKISGTEGYCDCGPSSYKSENGKNPGPNFPVKCCAISENSYNLNEKRKIKHKA